MLTCDGHETTLQGPKAFEAWWVFSSGEVIPLNWPCANLVLNFKKGNRKWQIYANMPYIHVRIHGLEHLPPFYCMNLSQM